MKRVILFLCTCFACSIAFAQNHYVPESGGFQFYMALTCAVNIDGIQQTSDQLEIGSFCGDQCRGSDRIEHWHIPIPNLPFENDIVYLKVFGNEGETITFKIFDHASNK